MYNGTDTTTNQRHLFLSDTTDKFKQMSKENIELKKDISITSQYLEYHIEKPSCKVEDKLTNKYGKLVFMTRKKYWYHYRSLANLLRQLGM